MDMRETKSAPAQTMLDGACPSSRALARITGKWSLEAVAALRGGPLRNHQLLRALPGISPKVLAQTLRELESNGLVVRTEFEAAVRHVEYALTELGRSLDTALAAVDRWAAQASG
jgi:DNA-binding HxlR family transcriptional regulator